MLDVTNSCNLRCPFCVNHWENSPAVAMSDALFHKSLTLVPLTWKGEFYISCLYEPTLHRNLEKLLVSIPSKYARRIQMTTNMTTQLSDDFLKALAECDLYQVNVSIDSLVPKVYESLRVNAKFDRFIDNLDRYVKFRESANNKTRLNLITVVCKINYAEIVELVKMCRDAFRPTTHEIRYAFESDANWQWLQTQNISDYDWDVLDDRLSKLSYPLHIEKPPHLLKSSKSIVKFQSTLDPILTINSQGIADIYGTDIRFDLNVLDNPFEILQRVDLNRE